MQYRRLTVEELKKFENEFIAFLALNGLDAASWEHLKINNPHKVESLLNQFSDAVFDDVLEKIEYLINTERTKCYVFRCLPDTIQLCLLTTDDADYNFKEKTLEDLMNDKEMINIFRQEKKYLPNRKSELFKMLQNGCKIANESFSILF